MKTRTDFVTNSSSSSFVCQSCKDAVSGYDIATCNCEAGHDFCQDCYEEIMTNENMVKVASIILEKEKNNGADNDIIEEFEEAILQSTLGNNEELQELFNDHDVSYDFPAEICPCCSFEKVTDHVKEMYMLEKLQTDHGKLEKEIKSKFNSEEEFWAWINQTAS